MYLLSAVVGVGLVRIAGVPADPHTGVTNGLLPASFTLESVALQNLSVVGAQVAGGALLGLPTAVVESFNGFAHGAVAATMTTNASTHALLLAVLPHAVFEIPAIWLSAAAGFVVPTDVARYLLYGDRDRLPRTTLHDVAVLSVTSVALMLVAAPVEVYVSASAGP